MAFNYVLDNKRIYAVAQEAAVEGKHYFTNNDERVKRMLPEEKVMLLGFLYAIHMTKSGMIPSDVRNTLCQHINTQVQDLASELKLYRDYSVQQVAWIAKTEAYRTALTKAIKNGNSEKALELAVALVDMYTFNIATSPIYLKMLQDSRQSKANGKPKLTKELIASVTEAWNALPSPIKPIKAINKNTERYKLLGARLAEYDLDTVISAINKIKNSAFLKGDNERGWVISFDWFVKPNNFIKVLEGRYDNTQKAKKDKLASEPSFDIQELKKKAILNDNYDI